MTAKYFYLWYSNYILLIVLKYTDGLIAGPSLESFSDLTFFILEKHL